MREILFRGKRLDNGEWVYGYLGKHTSLGEMIIDRPYITMNGELSALNFLIVDPSTVGQYTGLLDNNGKLIFEGDILEFEDCGEEGYEYKEGFYFTNRAAVCWENGRWQLTDFISTNSGVVDDMNDSHEDFISLFYYSEVIGNIHDNPELLCGGDE